MKRLLLFILFPFLNFSILPQSVDTIFTADEITSIEVIKNNPGELLLSNSETYVSKSTDYGKTWIPSSFDTSFYGICYDLSINHVNPNHGFLPVDSRLFKTNDSGENWFQFVELDGATYIDINPFNTSIIFVSGALDELLGPYFLYRSFDGGITWYDSLMNNWMLDFIFDPENSDIVYTFNFGDVFKTTDKGNTWFSILESQQESSIHTIGMDKDNTSIIYAGGSSFLKISTDGGNTWINIDASLKAIVPGIAIEDILLDENNPDRIYAGNRFGGLFLTENGGEDWEKVFDSRVYLLEVDKEIPRNIYLTTNYRRTALKLIDTFTVTRVNEIKNTMPSEYKLYQNFPNPFNPNTNFKFSVADFGFVSLKIFDMLGNEIATLINEEKAPGEYNIKFDALGLSSGVYFYKIEAGKFVQTKKLILIK